MRINSAKLQGNELILSVLNPFEAAKLVYEFKAGDYELSKVKKKRSLDANAYCWVLINKIAEKVHEPPVDVYRRCIRDLGCKTVVVCAQEDDVEEEIQTFLAGHIGRMVDLGDSKIPGCVVLHKRYGSSSYDVDQMRSFIDNIIQECIALDIEFKPQEEIEVLLKRWGEYEERIRG